MQVGRIVAGRFRILEKIGAGYEGEVYKVEEVDTKIKRAIKLFFPERNPQFKVSRLNAKKLDKLKSCPIVINYYSHETIVIKKQKMAFLTLELADGEILSHFLAKQRGNRLGIFPAIHLLYSIAKGVQQIHQKGEYHGDLHIDNIIINKFGLHFELKIIDLHHWGDSKKDNRDEDIIKMIKVFYETLGGASHYKKLPKSIKNIICGLKRSLILERFKTVTALINHLEVMDWSDAI